MALFKISKGQAANLPNTYHEGYCYFTTDDGKFYIDTSNEARVSLNAHISDGIRCGYVLDSSVENYKDVSAYGVTELFDGLLIAIQNNSYESSLPTYIKINNAVDTHLQGDDGYHAVKIDTWTNLTDEWKNSQVMLFLYDENMRCWHAISGAGDSSNATNISIIRYQEDEPA